ncbi:hypothetical protein [Saccharothrix australiensis]|uniref:hypothetical protein n=1 Tax=Saccharothrix australiensis TaxID=2072 RepID=UPI001FEA0C87|nr:hypothetical protein [Saccharothrix australiensis]
MAEVGQQAPTDDRVSRLAGQPKPLQEVPLSGAYRAAEVLERLGPEPETVVVVNDWTYTGSGHANDAEREPATALADRLRSRRQREYAREGDTHEPATATRP